jgi:hypothetical protein
MDLKAGPLSHIGAPVFSISAHGPIFTVVSLVNVYQGRIEGYPERHNCLQGQKKVTFLASQNRDFQLGFPTRISTWDE